MKIVEPWIAFKCRNQKFSEIVENRITKENYICVGCTVSQVIRYDFLLCVFFFFFIGVEMVRHGEIFKI